MELSKARITEFHEAGPEDGTVERLGTVVQGRVWAMMQRKLFDAGAARKLKWRNPQDEDGEEVEGVEDDDLLGENTDNTLGEDMPYTDEMTEMIGDEFMDHDEEFLFEDLIFGTQTAEDGDDLLHYFEEQERREVDMETDEMLFGSDADCDGSDGNDELVLGETGGMDGMLLDA